MDSRLTRVQQRFVTRERASNCTTSNSPRAERRRKRRASLILDDNSAVGGVTNTEDSISGPAKKRERLKLMARKLTTSPAIKLPRVGVASSARSTVRTTSLRADKKEQSDSTAQIHAEEVDRRPQPAAQSLPATPESPNGLDASATQTHTDSLSLQNLRRSPRVKKMKVEANKHGSRPEPCSLGGLHGKGKERRRVSPRKSKLSPARKKADSNKKVPM